MEIEVKPFIGRSPVPLLLEMVCNSGCLQMETPKRVQEIGGRTERLSVPRTLSFFLLFLSVLGFMSWPVRQFIENYFPLWSNRSKMILISSPPPTGLSHLQGMD